ncbi:MAG: hypothetical protein M9887_10635 [Chitinophagales bacterium]|nr:hypothetical protein [Chitinophagales bacterium]
MNKILVILISLCVLSCSKNKDDIPKEPDLSQVKITRVEQKLSPNQFPFENNRFMQVNYIYNELNQLIKIETWSTGGEALMYHVTYDDDQIHITLPETESLMDPILGAFMLKDINVKTANGKMTLVENSIDVYVDEEPEVGRKVRKVGFFYDDSIFNNNITTYEGDDHPFMKWNVGGNITSMKNQGERIAQYHISNQFPNFGLADIGQNLDVTLNYKFAPEIPRGLIAFVNQALSGLSNLGMEDYFFHWLYDIDQNTNISFVPVGDVMKNNYNLADWIVSFGLPQINTLNTNENQIIRSKAIKGKVFTDIDNGNVKYKQVDNTTYYNYKIDRKKRILDIANLVIYYEIIE